MRRAATVLMLLFCAYAWAQKGTIMFYNLENLFDTVDDTTKSDNDFLPESQRQWTPPRYYHKLSQTYKAVSACGGWDAPAIIGVCEVENDFVLKGLTLKTEFSKMGYKIAHFESTDVRGIDAAMLYNPKQFKLISAVPLRPYLASNTKTRDILYCKGLWGNDTLHVFVNHWPSRRGGQAKSDWKRLVVAKQLKQNIDSILRKNPQALIVAMGDLNDEITSKSLQLLITGQDGKPASMSQLPISKSSAPGSPKFRNRWYVYGHIIVSPALFKYVSGNEMNICNEPMLQEPDDKNLGTRPLRTYAGMRYLGGFSDHLPVFIRIDTSKK